MGGVDELRVKFSYAKLQVGIWAIMKVFISQIHSWSPAGCPVLGNSAASKADTISAFQELRGTEDTREKFTNVRNQNWRCRWIAKSLPNMWWEQRNNWIAL